MIAHYAADAADTPALFRRDFPYRRVRSGRSLLQARFLRSVCHYGRVVGDPTPLLSCYKPGREASAKTALGTSPTTRHTTRTHREYLPSVGPSTRRTGSTRARRRGEPPTAPDACPQGAPRRAGAAWPRPLTSGRRMRPPSPPSPSFRCPPTVPPGRSGRPRGGRRGGAEDRSDLCAHHRCIGYGIHRQRAIGAGAWADERSKRALLAVSDGR